MPAALSSSAAVMASATSMPATKRRDKRWPSELRSEKERKGRLDDNAIKAERSIVQPSVSHEGWSGYPLPRVGVFSI